MVGSSSVAFALPEKDADALIERGIELRQQKKDEEALVVFKEALAISSTPRARAQVALAEQALGLWVAAESDLVEALAANRDPWIVKNRSALEGALAVVGRHVGSLEVRGPEGAEVVLDGVVIGKLPASGAFRVEAGPRVLELRKPGFHPTARSLEIPPGGIARSAITLAPLSDTPAEPPVAASSKRAPDASRPQQPVANDGERGHVQRILGWTFALTGGAALAFGGVGLAVHSSLVDDYNASSCPGRGVDQSEDCKAQISDANRWRTISAIALIGGGVLTVGGVVLLVTAPSASPSRASSMLSCGPSAALGVICTGRF